MKRLNWIIIIISVSIILGMAAINVELDNIISANNARIENQAKLIKDMTVTVKAYDQLIIDNEALIREYQEYKVKSEMIAALEPLKDFFTEDDILSIIDEIPHGKVFRSDFLIMAGFGDSVREDGSFRYHYALDITPIGDDWFITPLAPGEVKKFEIGTVFGKALTIQHSPRVRSFYGHGSNVYYSALPGNKVEADTVIMKMGNTGSTYSNGDGSGAHLHFMIEVFNGVEWIAINPLPFIR